MQFLSPIWTLSKDITKKSRNSIEIQTPSKQQLNPTSGIGIEYFKKNQQPNQPYIIKISHYNPSIPSNNRCVVLEYLEEEKNGRVDGDPSKTYYILEKYPLNPKWNQRLLHQRMQKRSHQGQDEKLLSKMKQMIKIKVKKMKQKIHRT